MKPPPVPDPAAQAAEELQHLRLVARATHQHALARLEAEIAHLLRCVTQSAAGPMPSQQRRDLQRMVTKMQRFDVTPEKGRCKDLRRLNKLIASLADIVDQWP